MSSDLQFKIYEDFLHYFLPDGLLDFFGPVMAESLNSKLKGFRAQVRGVSDLLLARSTSFCYVLGKSVYFSCVF